MSIYETNITNPKKQLEFYKNLSEQLQQENQHLKMIIKEYERLDDGEPRRGFVITRVDDYNIDDLITYKDNWNKLKEYMSDENMSDLFYRGYQAMDFIEAIKDTMQELEESSDNNG